MTAKSTKPSKSGASGKSAPKRSGHQGPFRVAACWPHQEAPLLLSMVGGTRTVVATSFTPMPYDAIADTMIESLRDKSCDPEIAADLPRWLILLPYDTYAAGQDLPLIASERPMAWEIKAALLWESDSTEPVYIARDDAHTARFHLTMKTHLKDILTEAKKWIPPVTRGMTLLPTTSDDTYLDATRGIIRSIREGDFYQVNLLRYFNAPRAHGWDNLCAFMESNSGPQGALLTQGSRVVASLSPERFVEISPQDSSFQIETWPIKGTAARISTDERQDRAAGEALVASAKDQAELRMIIDLMRNDLSRVCQNDSVEVLSSGDLKGFKHVWHLEGHIKGQLSPGQTLGHLLSVLCPGGSITGAPKIAAMRRIRSDEGQSRGFFMGNFLRINHDGRVLSNILIRTLLSDNWMASARYAAGSGLVVKSIPEQELLEIQTKCAPVTQCEDSEDLHRSIKSLTNSTKRVTATVSGMRKFSPKASSDPMTPAFLGALIDDAITLCNARIKMHDAVLTITPSPLLDTEIFTVPVQLTQVLVNLLQNAVDATAEIHDKELRGIVIACTEPKPELIAIQVIDSGKGIPRDLAHKIFEPFFTTKPFGQGTGLGLSISKSIMESLGGDLTLTVEHGKTCFMMIIPRSSSSIST